MRVPTCLILVRSLVDVISGECKGEAELVQAPDAQEVGAQAVKPFDGAQPTEGYSYPIDQPVPEASLRPVNIKHAHAAFRASRLRVSGVVPPGAAVNAPNTVDAPGVDSGRLPTRHIPVSVHCCVVPVFSWSVCLSVSVLGTPVSPCQGCVRLFGHLVFL